ncbi:hypothetical protein, partial [Chitinophaga terrae (ex Kim and Jung 2007)]
MDNNKYPVYLKQIKITLQVVLPMGYQNFYTIEQLKDYKIIKDWDKEIKPNMRLTSKGNGPLILEKHIFDLNTNLHFNGKYVEEVIFYHCYFAKGIEFQSAVFEKGFQLHSCIIEGEIFTTGTTKFNGGFNTKYLTIKTLSISKGEFATSHLGIQKADKLSISGGTLSDFNIHIEEEIANLYIHASKITGDIFYNGNGKVADSIHIA